MTTATSYWYLFPAFVFLYVITRHFLHRIFNLPPCPYPSLPIIGHLYLLKRPLQQTLSNISAKHGPILLLQFGYRPVLVVSSPSAAEECLTKNDIVFASRPRLTVGEYIGSNYTSLSWAPYGDHWRNMRRISAVEILSVYRIQMLSGIRKEEIKLLIGRLAEKQSQPLEIKTSLYELTLNVMMRMIAGKRYYGDSVKDLEEAARFKKIMNDTFRLGSETYLGDFLPIIKRFKFGMKRMVELQKRRDEFIQGLIEEHRIIQSKGSEGPEKNKTMIEVLLSLQDTDSDYYKDEIIRSLMLVLLVAGTDTTATTMEWVLCLLINHPEVAKKAQIEIDNNVGHNRFLEESDLPKLPYLRCIISEAMRMYPVVPLLVPHESSEECMVGGFRVPRGTTLLINMWAIQNDEKIWDEPRKFKPERFQGMDGNLTIRDGFKLMPFGSGRRGCPGEALATRMVGLTLGSLVQCFDWSSVDGRVVKMTERSGFTVSKAEPLQAICTTRPSMINLLSQL